MKINSIPIELWEFIFRNYLSVEDLVSLSGISRHFYYLSHQITAFRNQKKREVKSLIQVESWPNIDFHRDISLKRIRILENNYAYHTWKDKKNVFFSISNFFPSPEFQKIRNRVVSLGVSRFLPPLEYFQNISSLQFSDFSNLDLPPVSKNIENILIKNSNIDSFPPNLKVNKLTINNSNLTTNLTSAKIIHTYHTFFITPQDSLDDVEELKLFFPSGIHDYSPFGKIKNLTLRSNYLTDLSFIREGCQILNISRTLHIQDLSPLKNISTLRELDISFCYRIRRIPHIKNLKKVRVEGCGRIAYLENFTKDGYYYIKYDCKK